jgi:hypothetical protein
MSICAQFFPLVIMMTWRLNCWSVVSSVEWCNVKKIQNVIGMPLPGWDTHVKSFMWTWKYVRSAGCFDFCCFPMYILIYMDINSPLNFALHIHSCSWQGSNVKIRVVSDYCWLTKRFWWSIWCVYVVMCPWQTVGENRRINALRTCSLLLTH